MSAEQEASDAFYQEFDRHCAVIEGAIFSKCNMNQTTREDARNAMSELKTLIIKSFEKLKSDIYKEACKESILSDYCKPSYASVVAPSIAHFNIEKTDDCCVIVSTVDEKSVPEDIKRILKAKIDPSCKSIGVKNIKNFSENKILVECISEKDKIKFQEEIKECVELKSSNFKKKNPTILVKNVPNEISDNELLQVIKNQNTDVAINEENWNQTKIRFTLKKFHNTRHVVIEMNANVRKNCTKIGFFKIMWKICKIEDFLVVNRCFSCLGYGHKAIDCKNKVACFKCANDHKSSECKEELQNCINCIRYNNKTKVLSKKVNTNHKPFSDICPTHTYMKKRAASNINYV